MVGLRRLQEDVGKTVSLLVKYDGGSLVDDVLNVGTSSSDSNVCSFVCSHYERAGRGERFNGVSFNMGNIDIAEDGKYSINYLLDKRPLSFEDDSLELSDEQKQIWRDSRSNG